MEHLGCPSARENSWGSRKRLIVRTLATLITVLACLTLAKVSVKAQMATPTQDRSKAWFLANFSKFVEWPEKAFPGPASPFVIRVVGNFPLGLSLGQVVSQQTAHGRKIEVRWKAGKAPLEDLRECQILFLSGLDHKRVAQILSDLQGSSVLVVGNTDGFLQAGGMINFVLENDQIRFEINPDAAARADLKLSSQLLTAARYVLKIPTAPKG